MFALFHQALREMMMDIGDHLELFKKAPPLGSGAGGAQGSGDTERQGVRNAYMIKESRC